MDRNMVMNKNVDGIAKCVDGIRKLPKKSLITLIGTFAIGAATKAAVEIGVATIKAIADSPEQQCKHIETDCEYEEELE